MHKIFSKKIPLSKLVIFIFVLLSFGIFLSGCTPSKDKINKAKNLVEDAEALIEQYRFADAVDKYEEAMSVDSGNYSIYKGLASIYMLKNREKDAIETLETGIKKARDKSKLYEMLGQIEMDQNKLDSAEKKLKSAVKEDGDNDDAQFLLAQVYVNKRDFEKARKYLDISKEAGDVYVKSQLLKAVLLGDKTSDAEDILNDIKDIDVDDSSITKDIENYAEILKKMDDLDEDEKSDKYVDVILASGALDLDYEDVVIDLLDKYKEVEEEYWEVHLYLGRSYYMNKDLDKAEEYLSNAEGLNPVDPTASWILGRVYAEKKDESEMVDSYKQAIELAGDSDAVNIRKEFAKLLVENELYTEAEEQYKQLEKDDKKNKADYQLKRAEVLLERDIADKADEVIDNIEYTKLSDEMIAEYNYVKALSFFENGERESAIKWIGDCIKVDEEENGYNAKYYLLKGQILFEQEKEDEAKKVLERAVDMDLGGDVASEAVKVLDRM